MHLSPRQVDLRGVAAVVDVLLERWAARGVEAETVMRLRTSSIQENDVVGLTLRRGRLHGRVMAFGGGWVDFEFSIDGTDRGNVLEIHPITNDGACPAVEALLGRLLRCFDEQMVEDITS